MQRSLMVRIVPCTLNTGPERCADQEEIGGSDNERSLVHWR